MSLSSATVERNGGVIPAADPPALADNLRDKVCEALSHVLNEGVDIHRCLAAQALGHIDSPVAVRALIPALLDEDEDVRTPIARRG